MQIIVKLESHLNYWDVLVFFLKKKHNLYLKKDTLHTSLYLWSLWLKDRDYILYILTARRNFQKPLRWKSCPALPVKMTPPRIRRWTHSLIHILKEAGNRAQKQVLEKEGLEELVSICMFPRLWMRCSKELKSQFHFGF